MTHWTLNCKCISPPSILNEEINSQVSFSFLFLSGSLNVWTVGAGCTRYVSCTMTQSGLLGEFRDFVVATRSLDQFFFKSVAPLQICV